MISESPSFQDHRYIRDPSHASFQDHRYIWVTINSGPSLYPSHHDHHFIAIAPLPLSPSFWEQWLSLSQSSYFRTIIISQAPPLCTESAPSFQSQHADKSYHYLICHQEHVCKGHFRTTMHHFFRAIGNWVAIISVPFTSISHENHYHTY